MICYSLGLSCISGLRRRLIQFWWKLSVLVFIEKMLNYQSFAVACL